MNSSKVLNGAAMNKTLTCDHHILGLAQGIPWHEHSTRPQAVVLDVHRVHNNAALVVLLVLWFSKAGIHVVVHIWDLEREEES